MFSICRKSVSFCRVSGLPLLHRIVKFEMSGYGENDIQHENVTKHMSQLRNPYREKCDVFTEKNLKSKDPIKQFLTWFEEAASRDDIEANAMTLATVNAEGKPSARMVLLKGVDSTGFQFFTNHTSRKALDLETNPYAALVLYWSPLHRSVRIEGHVERLSDAQSAEYFSTRPRASQIAAHVSSKQSTPIENREKLTEIESKIEEKFKGQDVPKPDFWGGYLVVPDSIEFWQGQSNRMHDRIRFRKKQPREDIDKDPCLNEGENGWAFERLTP